jgi:hypothetical protein
MSTILKALRRLENDEASQREEQRVGLRENLVSSPATPAPRRARAFVWLLAIPGAGLMGALVAALVIPMLLEGEPPLATPTPTAVPATSSPEPTEVARVAPPAPVIPEPARPRSSTPPQSVSAPSAPSPLPVRTTIVPPPARARATSAPSPQPARTASASSPLPPAPPSVVAPRAQADSEQRLVAAAAPDPEPIPRQVVESAPLASVAAEESVPAKTQRLDDTVRPIEISDDFAVVQRTRIPSVLVTQTIWHPRAERRIALIERLDASDGDELLRMREGDRIGSLELVSIEPAGVVFVHDGIELRRRVGARP